MKTSEKIGLGLAGLAIAGVATCEQYDGGKSERPGHALTASTEAAHPKTAPRDDYTATQATVDAMREGITAETRQRLFTEARGEEKRGGGKPDFYDPNFITDTGITVRVKIGDVMYNVAPINPGVIALYPVEEGKPCILLDDDLDTPPFIPCAEVENAAAKQAPEKKIPACLGDPNHCA